MIILVDKKISIHQSINQILEILFSIYLSIHPGIVPENTTAVDDYRLVKCGLGFTHLIAKPAASHLLFKK